MLGLWGGDFLGGVDIPALVLSLSLLQSEYLSKEKAFSLTANLTASSVGVGCVIDLCGCESSSLQSSSV
jgi:hypothetical protein